jgi:hypothetical protein
MTGASLAWTCDSAAESLPGLFAASDTDEDDAAMNYGQMSDTGSAAPTNPTQTSEAAEDGIAVPVNNSSSSSSDLEGQVAVPKDGDDASAEAKEAAAAAHIWVFHLIMMIGAIYMAMLLTNW